jgi:hypothetical protein
VSLAINARRVWADDEYKLQYSTNGSTYLDMIRIVPASSLSVTRINYDSDEPYQMWRLPATIKGTIYIRATDSNSGTNIGTLTVDELFVMNTGTPPAQPVPAAPTQLRATYSKNTRKAKLSWKDNATTETAYNIWFSTNGGSTWSLYSTRAANTVSYTTDALTRGLTYLFRVSAANAGGDSVFSNTVSVFAS